MEKKFFERFIVNPNFKCVMGIEPHYYKLSGNLICHTCCQDISGKPEIVQSYKEKLEVYRIVLPSCQSAECGDFICERKKPVKRRPAQGVGAQAAKRRR